MTNTDDSNIFVINLNRRTDRWISFLKSTETFTKLKFSRFNALDGKDPNITNNLDSTENEIFKSNAHKNTMCCFLSHFRLWKKIVQDNIPLGVIFEDDVIFSDNFANRYSNMIEKISIAGDLVYFGGRFKKDYSLSKKILNKHFTQVDENIYQRFTKGEISKYLHRTTHGYAVTNKGAAHLIDQTFEMLKRKNGKRIFLADSFLNNLLPTSNFKISDHFPHIVYSPPNYATSDISADRANTQTLIIVLSVTLGTFVIVSIVLIALFVKRKKRSNSRQKT